MKLAFFASDPIALDCIKYLHASPQWELACIVSNPDKPKGRGQKLAPNEISYWAIENGVELLRPEKSPTQDDMRRLRETGAEIILVMAYGHILKDFVLEYSKYPCLNLHASLLPDLRGASPVETAVALGYGRTGVSLMKISRAMDEGDVGAREEVLIDPTDCARDVRKKIAAAAALLLEKYLHLVAGGKLEFFPQDCSRATYTRKLDKSDMLLDFRKSAKEICDRIRAFGCGIFEYENSQYKIGEATVSDCSRANDECGKILCASAAEGFKIACAKGALNILKIQRPCAKMMGVKEFFSGAHIDKSKLLKSFENKNLLR